MTVTGTQQRVYGVIVGNCYLSLARFAWVVGDTTNPPNKAAHVIYGDDNKQVKYAQGYNLSAAYSDSNHSAGYRDSFFTIIFFNTTHGARSIRVKKCKIDPTKIIIVSDISWVPDPDSLWFNAGATVNGKPNWIQADGYQNLTITTSRAIDDNDIKLDGCPTCIGMKCFTCIRNLKSRIFAMFCYNGYTTFGEMVYPTIPIPDRTYLWYTEPDNYYAKGGCIWGDFTWDAQTRRFYFDSGWIYVDDGVFDMHESQGYTYVLNAASEPYITEETFFNTFNISDITTGKMCFYLPNYYTGSLLGSISYSFPDKDHIQLTHHSGDKGGSFGVVFGFIDGNNEYKLIPDNTSTTFYFPYASYCVEGLVLNICNDTISANINTNQITKITDDLPPRIQLTQITLQGHTVIMLCNGATTVKNRPNLIKISDLSDSTIIYNPSSYQGLIKTNINTIEGYEHQLDIIIPDVSWSIFNNTYYFNDLQENWFITLGQVEYDTNVKLNGEITLYYKELSSNDWQLATSKYTYISLNIGLTRICSNPNTTLPTYERSCLDTGHSAYYDKPNQFASFSHSKSVVTNKDTTTYHFPYESTLPVYVSGYLMNVHVDGHEHVDMKISIHITDVEFRRICDGNIITSGSKYIPHDAFDAWPNNSTQIYLTFPT